MKIFGLFLFLSVFGFCYEPSYAQTSGEDPYADYSYLWEENKKKKSKKKKSDQASPEINNTPNLTLPTDSLSNPNDSTNQEIEEQVEQTQPTVQDYIVPSDSTINDDIENLEESEEVLEEEDNSLNEDEQPDEPKIEEEIIQEEASEEQTDEIKDEKKKKEKKEKTERAPMDDFRAPMSSGGSGGGSFNGGFTVTLIDDQYFVGLTLQPEFSIGKVGVGLNVPILYGLDDQSVRTEMFKDGVGVARLITYIRYGVQKRDPIYVKVGQLNNTMIGFGGLVNNYTNTTSFEKRKVGMHYDINYQGFVGIDGLYSDFNAGSFNLLVMRPYVRPLSGMPIPIIKTTEIGMTFVNDKDQTEQAGSKYTFTKDGIGAFGIDMGMTLLKVPFIQIDFFANYSRLNVSSQALSDSLTLLYTPAEQPEALNDGFENGSGASVGFNFRLNFIADVLSTDIRIERLNYSEHYVPQFFNASYELNKDARILSLASAGKMSGIYGSLTGHILQKVTLGGSLMIPDEISEASPAFVEVNGNVDRLADKVSVEGSYFKGNLSDLSDAFKLDENSLAKVRVMYHLNKFMAAGMDYYWAFTPVEGGRVEATQYVAPYFGLSISF